MVDAGEGSESGILDGTLDGLPIVDAYVAPLESSVGRDGGVRVGKDLYEEVVVGAELVLSDWSTSGKRLWLVVT